MGDVEDLSKRCVYRLGRIHAVHPQIRQGKKIVRRATIAVFKNTGSGEIEYVLGDVGQNSTYLDCVCFFQVFIFHVLRY